MRRVLVFGVLSLLFACNKNDPPPAVQLVFVTQPTTVAAGAPFAIDVELQDSKGLRVQQASGTVTLSLPTTSSDTLDGHVTVEGKNGRASFVNLVLHKADPAVVLKALVGGIPAASSAPIAVTAADPDHDHCSISVAGSGGVIPRFSL